LCSAAAHADPDPALRLAYWLQALGRDRADRGLLRDRRARPPGPVAGLVAAALVATSPPLVTVTGALLSEPLGGLLPACGELAVTWALREGRLRLHALAGVVLAGAVLTRTDVLPGPPLVAAVVVLALRASRPSASAPTGDSRVPPCSRWPPSAGRRCLRRARCGPRPPRTCAATRCAGRMTSRQ
jgi:hypothetical protein